MAKKLLPNTWSSKRNKEESGNYNLVMNRTWYGIAGSDPNLGKMDAFWEFNSWIPGKEGQRFNNHTITRNLGKSKIKDFGIWNGFINKNELYALQPVVKFLGIRMPMPVKLATNWLTFPKNDSFDQVWTYYGDLVGMRIFFMFALTPHLSEEAYQAELKRLQDENKLDLEKTPFYKVQWSDSYQPGDSGEDKIN